MNQVKVAPAMLVLFACAAFSGSHPATPPPKPQPTEVKIVSVPATAPTEVKITSMPLAPPFDVNVKSSPPDDTASAMVQLTKWLVIANISLCVVTVGLGAGTVWSTLRQSGDQKRRDLAAMRREVSRSANEVMVMATRMDQMAAQVPPTRSGLHVLIGQSGMPPAIKHEIDEALLARHSRLREMVDNAKGLAFAGLSGRSETELVANLWRLDAHEAQLDGMRDAITRELEGYDKDALALYQVGTAQAAVTAAKLNQPKVKSRDPLNSPYEPIMERL
jgi:hypothetical protein